MHEYLIDICGFEKPFVGFIGIRADEVRRAVKMNGKIESGQERYLPLYLDGVIAKDVGRFWSNNDFDLNLPNNNGVTDLGNCDLCFLKGYNKKQSIIRERPELADWWIEKETIMEKSFRHNRPNYISLVDLSKETPKEYIEDQTFTCFCHD